MQTLKFATGAYLLMGYLSPIQKPILPPVMADNKIRDRKIGTKRVNLGIKFVTKHLLITIEDYKIERLKFILKETWCSRKSFTAIDAARLIGNVLACLQVCQWL